MVSALQQYEDSVRMSGTDVYKDLHQSLTPQEEPEIDYLFLAASQGLESKAASFFWQSRAHLAKDVCTDFMVEPHLGHVGQ